MNNLRNVAHKKSVKLTEAQVKELFESTLSSWDALKSGVKKGFNWTATKAGNVTTKITADKLMSMWKKAGKPTDSSRIEYMMAANGIPGDIAKQSFEQMQIPYTGGAAAPAAPASAPAPAAPAAPASAAPAAGGARGGRQQQRQRGAQRQQGSGTATTGGQVGINYSANLDPNTGQPLSVSSRATPTTGAPANNKKKKMSPDQIARDRKRNPGNYAIPTGQKHPSKRRETDIDSNVDNVQGQMRGGSRGTSNAPVAGTRSQAGAFTYNPLAESKSNILKGIITSYYHDN